MDDGRLMLTDEVWARIEADLAKVKSRAGAPPTLSDRDFFEAMLYMARNGGPWRDLPARFGTWDAVYQRFRRWQKAGRWLALLEGLPELESVSALFVDSTIIRAHPHAAGALREKGGPRRRPSAGAWAGSAPRSTPPSPTSGPRSSSR
jgi:transposase